MSARWQQKELVRAEIREIARAVAEAAGQTEQEMFGQSRRHAWARQCAMWLASKLTGASMAEIGRAFGRDHTTVIYGIDRAEEMLRDVEFLEPGASGVRLLCRPFLAGAMDDQGRMQRQALFARRQAAREEIMASMRAIRKGSVGDGEPIDEADFYDVFSGGRKKRRAYLVEQNRRMLEALLAAEDRR